LHIETLSLKNLRVITLDGVEGMAIPHIRTDYAYSRNYRTLVEVTDTGGVLTGLGVAGGVYYHYFRVWIDGRMVVDDFLCGNIAQSGNNGLGVNLPFERELIVQIKDSDPTPLPRFWCSFITHGSKKIEETFEIREINGVRYVYKIERFKHMEKVYTIESSYGGEKVSKIILERDTYAPGESIKGVIKLRNWKGERLREEKVPLILRYVGRRTELARFTIGPVDGEYNFKIPGPRFRGQFEIVCDLKGYVNFPAVFTMAEW
jgi:hypothetical protein